MEYNEYTARKDYYRCKMKAKECRCGKVCTGKVRSERTDKGEAKEGKEEGKEKIKGKVKKKKGRRESRKREGKKERK